MARDPKLSYPVFVIESDHSNEFTGFKVIRNRFDFTVFGRVPNSAKYTNGYLFDCEGRSYTYEGAAGWPRFSPALCKILDSIILPGLVSKVLETAIYFGPKPVALSEPNLEGFKSMVVSSIERHQGKPQHQLRKVIASKGSFREIIEGIEWWAYHGGIRDPDGHPDDSPEYNP